MPLTGLIPERVRLAVGTPGPISFALLSAVDSMSRATLAALVPLLALQVFGSARNVSAAFSAVGWAALGAVFVIPWMIRRFGPRRVYLVGGVILVASPMLFWTGTQAGWIAGQMGRLLSVSTMTISLSLFIMAYIPKQRLSKSEPLRTFFSAIAWSMGPWLGVYLGEQGGEAVAYAFSMACGGLVLLYAVTLKLADPAGAVGTRTGSTHPWRNIRRFVAQPRLVLAWLLNFGREIWWAMFFIYLPIYMVQSGESPTTGALVLSMGTGMLFVTPLMGWIGRKIGLRRFHIACFLTTASISLATAVLFDRHWIGAALLLVGALASVGLDAVAYVPFMRAVRARERPEMTMVFSTYRDFAWLLPTALFTVILSLFDLSAVFAATGACLLVFAWLARYLPRGM